MRPKHDSPNALCASLANSSANEAFENEIDAGLDFILSSYSPVSSLPGIYTMRALPWFVFSTRAILWLRRARTFAQLHISWICVCIGDRAPRKIYSCSVAQYSPACLCVLFVKCNEYIKHSATSDTLKSLSSV